tara:strand:+ start:87 stop:1319 length:1233 start_codon:yes stop_codon:yes gene_type:complete
LVNHWLSFKTNIPFVPNLKKFGFVYLITNTQTKKAYVGCKQYYVGRTKKQHKWGSYTGSSKYLNEDIKQIGKKHFKFEVIAEYKNKRSLRYYEAYYQIKWHVLTAVIPGSDNPAFYNSYVGGKWYRPVESFEEQWSNKDYRKKMSEVGKKSGKKYASLESVGRTGHPRYIGECEVVFKTNEKKIKILDGKEVTCYKTLIVDNLTHFCVENNYNKGRVHALIVGYITYNTRDTTYLKTGEKRTYRRRRTLYKCNKHKDIINVILLNKEKNNEAQLRIKDYTIKYKLETDTYDSNETKEEKKTKTLNRSKAGKNIWKTKPQKTIDYMVKKATEWRIKNRKPIRIEKINGDIVEYTHVGAVVKDNYLPSCVDQIAKKYKNKSKNTKCGYTIRKTHKDIIKVEFIERKEETNGD